MKIASKAFVGMMMLAACAKASSPDAPAPVSDSLVPIKAPAGVTVTHSVKSYAVMGTDRRTIRAQLHVPDGSIVARNYAGRY